MNCGFSSAVRIWPLSIVSDWVGPGVVLKFCSFALLRVSIFGVSLYRAGGFPGEVGFSIFK